MAKKYCVIVEEIVSESFELEAESEEEAISKAIKAYRSGEFVLEPGNFEYAQVQVIDEDGKSSNWVEV